MEDSRFKIQELRTCDDGIFMKAVFFHSGTGPDDGVFELNPLGDGGLGADDTGFSIDVGVRVDHCVGVNGVVAVLSQMCVNG